MVTGLAIKTSLFNLYMHYIIFYVLFLFQCDSFPTIITQHLLENMLDLTKAVQQKCFYGENNLFQNVNSVTFHVLLKKVVPYVVPKCIATNYANQVTNLNGIGKDNALNTVV